MFVTCVPIRYINLTTLFYFSYPRLRHCYSQDLARDIQPWHQPCLFAEHNFNFRWHFGHSLRMGYSHNWWVTWKQTHKCMKLSWSYIYSDKTNCNKCMKYTKKYLDICFFLYYLRWRPAQYSAGSVSSSFNQHPMQDVLRHGHHREHVVCRPHSGRQGFLSGRKW